MTERREVAHVLRRLTFGPTAAEVDAAVRDGLPATVDRVLAPAAPVVFPSLPDDKSGQQEAIMWWVAQMAAHGGTAAEKLTFFWHGHWATSVQKVRSAALMLTQQKTFRTYGSGPTGPLVRAMLRDPALIVCALAPIANDQEIQLVRRCAGWEVTRRGKQAEHSQAA